MTRKIVLTVAVATLWACPDRPVFETNRGGPQPTGECIQASSDREVDILFVVDDSRSMQDEQDKLQDQFDALVDVLAHFPGGFPNLHIGVTSTDLCGSERAQWGRLHGFGLPSGVPFIEITNANGRLSGNIPNVDTPTPDGLGCRGEVAADDNSIDVCDIQVAFRGIASLGTAGCGFEQPLEAAYRALDCGDGVCTNGAFLRDQSLLAVVFLGDEDDCSAFDRSLFSGRDNFDCFLHGVVCDQPIDAEASQELTGCRPHEESEYLYPVQRYHDFFSTLRPAGRLVLAAIAGPHMAGDAVRTAGQGQLVPSCTAPESCQPANLDECQSAAPAIRIHDLVRRFGDNGVILSDFDEQGICADDYGPALARVGELIGYHIEKRCIEAPLVHKASAGPARITDPTQAVCSVSDVLKQEGEPDYSVPLEQCRFADDTEVVACPPRDASPGTLAKDAGHPCWYVCDAGPAEEGGCEFRWEMRLCRDPGCDPKTPATAGTDSCVQCVTCDPLSPGCLCGDRVCQGQVGENDISCPKDCS